MGRNSVHLAPAPPWLPDFRKACKRDAQVVISVDVGRLLASTPAGSILQATSVTVLCRTSIRPAAFRVILSVRRDVLRPLWHMDLVDRAPGMIVLSAASDCVALSGTESQAAGEMDGRRRSCTTRVRRSLQVPSLSGAARRLCWRRHALRRWISRTAGTSPHARLTIEDATTVGCASPVGARSGSAARSRLCRTGTASSAQTARGAPFVRIVGAPLRRLSRGIHSPARPWRACPAMCASVRGSCRRCRGSSALGAAPPPAGLVAGSVARALRPSSRACASGVLCLQTRRRAE